MTDHSLHIHHDSLLDFVAFDIYIQKILSMCIKQVDGKALYSCSIDV